MVKTYLYKKEERCPSAAGDLDIYKEIHGKQNGMCQARKGGLRAGWPKPMINVHKN